MIQLITSILYIVEILHIINNEDQTSNDIFHIGKEGIDSKIQLFYNSVNER